MEGKKPKILLCEDDNNLGSVLKNYLELNDYDVTLERDGRLGLAAFQREKFDICLLDVMMPNMDGFTLAEEIRDVDPDIPLFFLSAKTMKEDVIQGYKLGADDYITKPFSIRELLARVKAVLRRSESKASEGKFLANLRKEVRTARALHSRYVFTLSSGLSSDRPARL